MDSGTLGANDKNSDLDLNGRERLRLGDIKVYTRKKFRKKAHLEPRNYDFATTTTAVNGEPTSSSPGKHEFGSNNATLEPSSVETLAAGNGNSSEGQPQSRYEGEPSISDVGRPPEGGTDGEEPVPSRGEDPLLNGDREDEAVPDGGREEAIPSSGHEATLPEMQPSTGGGEPREEGTDGQEAVLGGGEDQPVNGGREILPDVQEVVPHGGREEPVLSSGHEALPEMQPSTGGGEPPEEGTGDPVTLPSGGADLPLNGDQEVLPDVGEAVPNGGRDEPTLSSGHEALTEMQPLTGEREPLEEGTSGPVTLLSGGAEPPLNGDQEVLPDAEEAVSDGGRDEPTPSSSHEALPEMKPSTGEPELPEESTRGPVTVPSGGKDPPLNGDQEVLPDVQEAVPKGGRGEPIKSSGQEALPEMQPIGEQELLEDGTSGQVAVPSGGADLPLNGDQEVLPDAEEAVSDGGRDEPTPSSSHEALPEMQPSTGERELPEEGTRGPVTVPSGGEDPPLNGDQEVLPDVQEAVPQGGRGEPIMSSGHETLPEMQPIGGQELLEDGTSGQVAVPSGGADPPLNGDQEVLLDVEEVVSDGGRDEPTLSSSHEALPEMQHSTGERLPPEEGTCGPVTVPSGGENPPLNGDQEVLPDVQEAVPKGGRGEPIMSSGHEALPEMQPIGGQELLEDGTSGQVAVPSRGADPPLNGDQEVLPDVQDVVPNGRREEPTLSSGCEALPEMQPTGGQEDVLPNGGEEQLTRSNGPEAEEEAVSRIREEPQEREQSEVAVTMPTTEGPDVAGGLVNGVASVVLVNGFPKPVVTRIEDRVRINITGSKSKHEMRKLKRKLESELDRVRSLVEKVVAKENQLTAYSTINVHTNTRYGSGSVDNFGAYNQPQLLRANSEVGTVAHPYSRPLLMRVNSEAGSVGYQETRPFRPLSVSVMENNHGAGEYVEKEKRTPKANQYYRNSEFLLGKDRLPSESNKKLKLSAKKHGGDSEYGYGFGFDKNRDKVLKSCSNLLQRLMKHKHGWVFNEPVDAKKLNIPDYHIIIKHPMDFGTIKTRLAQNWYKSAREFAEDVRLVFRNSMTYNPKGQDVHTMAEELSKIFEERWVAIEKEFFPYQMYYDAGLPIPTRRKAPPPHAFAPIPSPILAPVSIPQAPPMRTLDRSESMMKPVDSRLKPSYSIVPQVGRTSAPKKPKAKDPNKRDMTFEEKQKLSTNLQSLPSEKLDAIVQIIKKRNSALSQHDDEIEVDIDNVDAETLWELDRFVTNYKKSLSKNKRKAELALQRRAEAAQAVPATNSTPAIVEAQKESRTGEKSNPPVVEVEKQGDNVSGSSSSSSSSSDSGSSSSDSDSDSSSAYGSDAGQSPKT